MIYTIDRPHVFCHVCGRDGHTLAVLPLTFTTDGRVHNYPNEPRGDAFVCGECLGRAVAAMPCATCGETRSSKHRIVQTRWESGYPHATPCPACRPNDPCDCNSPTPCPSAAAVAKWKREHGR